MRRLSLMPVVVLLAAIMVAAAVHAAGMPEFHIAMKNHKFEPATLKVPANTKFKLLVTNHNTMPSEFESTDFNREKIVMPNSTVTVFIGPLKKGTYKFYDDFHQSTTGTLIVE